MKIKKELKNLDKVIEDLKQGDEAAFDIIYDNFKDLVFYIIISILKDRSTSEEVMQDTFLRMYNNIHRYESSTNFKAWLLKIAKNLAINEYHRKKIDIAYDDNLVNEINVENNQAFELIKTLEIYLEKDELEVVILYIVYNMKHREIADFLEKPLGTVLWLYNKGIKKLKQNYRERG